MQLKVHRLLNYRPVVALAKRTYQRVRDEFLNAHSQCTICGSSDDVGVHHIAGRKGQLLANVVWFMAVCNECHVKIHKFVEESIKNGWIVKLRKGEY